MDEDLIRQLRERSKEWRKYADQLESTARLIERLEGSQPTLFSRDAARVSDSATVSFVETRRDAVNLTDIGQQHQWQIIKEVLAESNEPLTKAEILERMHKKGYIKTKNPKALSFPLSRKSFFKTDGKGKWRLEEDGQEGG